VANTLLTPTAVTNEALRILHQRLNFVGNVNRTYDDSFAKSGAKIGDELKIRLPNEYTVRTGKTLDTQDTGESSVTLTVATQKGVDLNFSSAERTMDLDDFSKRILEPAMNVLAANIESDAFSMYKDVYNQVNNTGSAATFAKLLAGRKILVDNLAPPGDLNVCLNTQDNVDLVDALKGLFHSQKEISKQYRDGYLGRTAGFDFMENTVIPAHTRGAANTSYTTDTRVSALPLVSTAVSSITVASGSGAVAIGDVFTIANVFRVHPETKVSTGVLQQFVATAVMASAGTTLSISPSIILAGAKQNVTIPSTSATAALTWAGTLSTAHGISLAFHRDAFAFATADLVMPEGVDFAARKVLDGISMRIVRAYDINNDNFPCRLDVLYGYKTLRPQIACRLANN
jgi:hypothetical protein